MEIEMTECRNLLVDIIDSLMPHKCHENSIHSAQHRKSKMKGRRKEKRKKKEKNEIEKPIAE